MCATRTFPLLTPKRLDEGERLDEGKRLDGAVVKSATGGDPFEFTPEFKLWLATNHLHLNWSPLERDVNEDERDASF